MISIVNGALGAESLLAECLATIRAMTKKGDFNNISE